MVLFQILNNLPNYARNFVSLMGRSNVIPIDLTVLFKELIEALFVTMLYPIVTFVGLYLQFIRWIWVMLFRLTVPAPQQLASGMQIKSCIITGIASNDEMGGNLSVPTSGDQNSSNNTISMAYSLAKSLCFSWMKMVEQNIGVDQDHRMITLVGSSDEYLTEMRESLIKELGESFVKNIEIRIKVGDATDEEKIRKIVTEYDYDLVIACQPCGFITTTPTSEETRQLQSTTVRRRDTKGQQEKKTTSSPRRSAHNQGNVNFEEKDMSNNSPASSFQNLTIIGEETIRQQFTNIIQPTLNTIMPAIKQASERGVIDSPKHVVVGLVNEADTSVSNHFVNDFALQLPKLVFSEISSLINRSLRTETLFGGNQVIGNQFVDTDLPSKSQLVFQLINPITCQSSDLPTTAMFRGTTPSSTASSSVGGGKEKKGKLAILPPEYTEKIPSQISNQILKEIYKGIEVIDVNRPLRCASRRFLNVLPYSIGQVVQSIFDL